ncbi:MAG: adenylate/guanylate cyclase domain-containing protein [Chloroflexi bacterium]|nr:MAG: adenylate/guanylate cyclase domain-containing protein [Chloroflexota bacterium]
MSEEPAGHAARWPITMDKESARLARRVGRLEATLATVELIRDTNARLLDRLMGELEAERARSQTLLLNVLPQPIIDRLNAGEQLIADRYDDVAVVFSDLVGFTEISSRLPVATLVSSLNALFSAFDKSCQTLGVEKIKTIGDAYMAAAGLPGTEGDHVSAAADLALAMRAAVRDAGEPWQVRIGLHAGPVVAGVIGTSKFVYDLWGDAVNVASRLETTAPPGTIQVSEAVATALGDAFELEARQAIDLKGKGSTNVYYLIGRKGALRRRQSRPRTNLRVVPSARRRVLR